MAFLDGILGRSQARFDDAPSPPPAEDRRRGPRPGPLGALGQEEGPEEEREEALPPARSHLGRVLDLVG